MNKISETIVFFGSGPVAAESLRLLQESFDIEAVVTKPRAEHHKGAVPVLELCETLGLKAYTPSNKTELSTLFNGKPFASKIGIVIDYGIIINKDVIDYFPFGIINSHFSRLPELRGADPITFAILSGQKQTGVSLMSINEKMDEGLILAVGLLELADDITTPALTHDLIGLSNGLLKAELPRYLSGETELIEQSEVSQVIPDYPVTPTYSRKLTKDDGVLDFTKSAEVLEREIRAFIEWPKSRTTIGGIDVIITAAHVVPGSSGAKEIVIDTDIPLLELHCSVDRLCIDKLKPAGKKEMTVQEFLNGYSKQLTK